MNRAIAGALAGWTAIVVLAWGLAELRLTRCEYWRFSDSPCIMHALTVRDAVLIWGPAVPVAILALVGLVRLLSQQRLNRSGAAPQPPGPEARRLP